MVASFAPGSPPTTGTAKELFQYPILETGLDFAPTRCYDLTPDGQRFYATQRVIPAPPAPVTQIRVVTNWLYDELRQKTPVK
jgi:hypothetical protein